MSAQGPPPNFNPLNDSIPTDPDNDDGSPVEEGELKENQPGEEQDLDDDFDDYGSYGDYGSENDSDDKENMMFFSNVQDKF